MAVHTLFDPQPKGVRFFSDEGRDNAYLETRPFFLEQLRLLLKVGWKRNNCNSEEVYPPFTNSAVQYSLFIIALISSYSISPSKKKVAFGGLSFPTHSPISLTYLRLIHGAKFLKILRHSTLLGRENTRTLIFTSGHLFQYPTFSTFSKSLHPECWLYTANTSFTMQT